ncbi:MAG: hypothetical protein MUF36_08385 [Bacteroidales bacterium]|jgi:WD40 repeat protein|nr:hypothetical protein [Bacteroidales bacterium]
MTSPFKFLDSYTREDRAVFFGREQEITELYRRVFESRILLVYGVSGTGKSSLINCGLASRFDESDWLPVNVRRGNNIVESLDDAINKQAIRPLKKSLTITEKLQSIYLDHFKPVYLVFDQFEELFIFGTLEERTEFTKLIKEIVRSKVQCRIILVIREEFLAGITEFEDALPEIFSNRFRVEKMKKANAILAVEGPCKVHNIKTEQGFSEELVDKLIPSGQEIELTYLQIYLDRIFRLAISEQPAPRTPQLVPRTPYPGISIINFPKEILTKAGSVSDLLGQFLEEQIREMEDPETGMSILKSFVSVQGTRRPMTEKEILDSIGSFGSKISEPDLLNYLTKFVDLRILTERDEAGHFELRHDALAAKIFEKFTALEKDIIEVRQFIDNSFSDYQKRGRLLTGEDLKYIAPYEEKLFLNKESEAFIYKSRNEIFKSRKRRRTIAAATAIMLIIVLSGFTVWALNERRKAVNEREIANQNYQKAKANNLNYLSQKMIDADPTTAMRLAEYAHSIDSINQDIGGNLVRIYYDNSFYQIVSRHKYYIGSVAFSPDGKSILTGSDDKTAQFCDLNGNLLMEFRGHESFVRSVAFSPDGKSILTGSSDTTARLWDLQGNVLYIFKGHEDWINSVAFSPDGNNILTGSDDRTARLWDLQGRTIRVFTGHEASVNYVAFSPDGKSILTGSDDKFARMWDLKGNVLQVFKGHEDGVCSIAFSPDGKSILTASDDKSARLWDLAGNLLKVFVGHGNYINSAAFSPNGMNILTGSSDKTARLWDLQGNLLRVFKGHEDWVNSVTFSSDGNYILTGSDDKTARLWDLAGIEPTLFKGHEKGISAVALSSDGRWILTGSNDKTARLYDLNGNEVQVFKGHEREVISVAFSPDAKKILTGSKDKIARLWDMNGNGIHVYKGHGGWVNSVVFSPDGSKIITGSADSTARLWDLKGNLLQVFSGHHDKVFSAVFSPDGNYILTGSDDKTARLWDMQGNVLQVFKGHENFIHTVAFSPDGENILTGSCDFTARLWDRKGNVLQVFQGHELCIHSVAFSPDGMTIITGSPDATARIWSLKGSLLQVFNGFGYRINSVAISPDGKNILIGSDENIARLWNVKGSIEKFQLRNNYQELSIAQKIKYGVLEFSDILKLDNEKAINEAAEYYSGEARLLVKDKKTEYINSALGLYKILAERYDNNGYRASIDSLILMLRIK